MKITILGSPQAGQQELFSVLTGIDINAIKERPMEVQLGICNVSDPRIDELVKLYKPKKTTYAKIEYVLLPDFNLQGPAKEKILTQLKNADELCWIAKHENAESDIGSFISELILSDMMLVEKRIENLDKNRTKKNSDQSEKEKKLIEKFKQQLEAEKPISIMELSEEEIKAAKAYQLLTMKPVILVINVPEGKIKEDTTQGISKKFSFPVIQLSAELESEISQLEASDQKSFMSEMGITEPALNKMTIMAYLGLGLISFFTVGEDEVRAWPVKKNSLAPQAGRVIHTDIERGFVRAEMFKYTDLLSAGSEAKLKEQGKFSLKGKDYIVEDGDILSFRFNV